MKLTKHRDKINLEMSTEELIFLVNVLGSDPQSAEEQEKVTETLRELTKFQQYFMYYGEYPQEMQANT